MSVDIGQMFRSISCSNNNGHKYFVIGSDHYANLVICDRAFNAVMYSDIDIQEY